MKEQIETFDCTAFSICKNREGYKALCPLVNDGAQCVDGTVLIQDEFKSRTDNLVITKYREDGSAYTYFVPLKK